jgi:hypothetical protein
MLCCYMHVVPVRREGRSRRESVSFLRADAAQVCNDVSFAEVFICQHRKNQSQLFAHSAGQRGFVRGIFRVSEGGARVLRSSLHVRNPAVL